MTESPRHFGDTQTGAVYALDDTAALLAAIVSASNDAILSKTLDGIITSWNRAAERLFGYSSSEMIGHSIRRLIPADLQSDEDRILARIASGDKVENYETIRVHKSGRLIDVSITVSPVRDAAGKISGASKIVRDISERKQADEKIKLLLAEVNHRAKNLLAIVQSIATRTAGGDPAKFAADFADRVQSLAASHDLLVKSHWRGVELQQLAHSQLSHAKDLLGSRIVLKGPDLVVSASAAQSLGMALHELLTNAVKYGALANDRGRIEVRWDLVSGSGQDEFVLSWQERDGPAVSQPLRRGFGTTVIDKIPTFEMQARVTLSYAPSGFKWHLICPAERVLVQDTPQPRTRPRILVVEDDALLALDLADTLDKAGFAVIGPASSPAAALALIRQTGCDAAVLDVQLGKETSEVVAKELIALGRPFVVTTGYATDQLPQTLLGAPRLTKPVRAEDCIEQLRSALKACADGPNAFASPASG